jgi:protein involved in polysaccharide export with SLBB domain
MNGGGQEDRGSWEGGRARPPAFRRPRRLPALLLVLALAGCAHTRREVDRRLLAGRGGEDPAVAAAYLVGCPDVLEVTVAGRPELACRAAVAVDGSADLGALGRLRVEGRAPARVAAEVAARAGAPAERVGVRVAEYNSQQVYLFGEVNGLQRAVAYRGPETVLDLLQRAGGLAAGAAPEDVYVIRPHLVEGTRPEVFHVDLRAIVLKGDPATNLRLQPADQVHVGETRQAKLEHCIPPWLRSLCRTLFGQRAE